MAILKIKKNGTWVEVFGALDNNDNKVSLPMSGETPIYGTSGQFALSDGSGGIVWKTLTNVSEEGA